MTMKKIPEQLLAKIENNIKKIGTDLKEFSECANGDYCENGKNAINLEHIFTWTQSFFTGMSMWAYVDTGKAEFLNWVMQFKDMYRQKVARTAMDTMHDLGFLYSPYAVMAYKICGDEEMKQIGIDAANALAMRYDPKGRYIKAWGRIDGKIPDYVSLELSKDVFFRESDGLAIIDCMMNLPLLFWASEVTGHPFYKKIAICHADTIKKYFVREDYSVMHAFRFSEESGTALGEACYCGYANGSYWARGAAWAIYGFALAYTHTGKGEYLDTSVALLNKFMYECNCEMPVWDFRLPEYEEKAIDTSAAAVVVCAIIEIQKYKIDTKLEKYKQKLWKRLTEYINYDENVMGILKEQNGRHVYTSFGDYFLIEAMMKEESDLNIW